MLFPVKVVKQDKYDGHSASLVTEGNPGVLGDDYDANQNVPGTKAPVRDEE
jgi:cytochrome c oxidase subunit 2